MKQYIKNFLKYRFLLFELVKKGIKLKYRRSYLGLLWTLIEPLLTMIVLTVIFGTLLGNSDKTFAIYILTGRLLFSFFSAGTTTALRSIQQNAGMIKKVYLPKYLYPLSCILYNYVIFALSLIVLAIVSLVLKVYPTFYTLLAIIPMFVLLLFTFSVGMILSTLTTFFRDVEYLWGVVTMLIMYMSAIFYYPDAILRSEYAWLLKYNPLYRIIEAFRDTVIYGRMFNVNGMLYSSGLSLILLVIGIYAFVKKQDEFILHV